VRLLRLLPALTAAGLLLSACGALTPGAAATVDDRTISMSELDDTARVYCEINALTAQQQGVKSIDNAAVRRQAATDLVLERVAADVAEQRDVTAPAPRPPDDDQLVEFFGDRAPEVADTLAQAQNLYALLAAIGSDAAGVPITDANRPQLTTAGRDLVVSSFGDHDVEFSPRLGLSDSGEPSDQVGSLSVTAEAAAASPDDLPQALRCSA
jgi:hypothetical protein